MTTNPGPGDMFISLQLLAPVRSNDNRRRSGLPSRGVIGKRLLLFCRRSEGEGVTDADGGPELMGIKQVSGEGPTMERGCLVRIGCRLDFAQNGATRMTTAKTYDLLNRLTEISSSTGGVAIAEFAYAYNAANQRIGVTNVDASRWIYTYDPLGQVTSGKRYWNDGTTAAGQQFEYGFDDIGNRRSASSGGNHAGAELRTENYTANNVNQYKGRFEGGGKHVVKRPSP